MRNLFEQKVNEYTESQPELAPFLNEVDYEYVESCFSGQSQSPERRGAMYVVEHAQRLVGFKVELKKSLEAYNKSSTEVEISDQIDSIVEAEFVTFRANLLMKFNDFLHAESSCVSWHVTGPANFPVAKAERKFKAAQEKGETYYSFAEYVTKKVLKKYFPNGDGSVIKMSSDNPSQALEKRIEKLELAHSYMKIANSLVPKAYKKANNAMTDEQFSELELKMLKKGIPASLLNTYLEPNPINPHWGRFSLQNSNANIRRLKGRLTEAKNLEATRQDQSLEGTLENGISHGIVDGRIAVWLGFKPTREITTQMRKFGLKFSPSRNNAWVRAHTGNAEIVFYRSILPFIKAMDTEKAAA